MNRAQIFPAIMIVMNLGAAVMCASCGELRRIKKQERLDL